MIQDRRFALTFRICAFLFAVIGIMAQVGVFSGEIGSGYFLYYTIQSNLLVAVLFFMLAVRTAKSLKEKTTGGSGWYARFEMVCTVNILLTMIVFWLMLAPQISIAYILTFENTAVHTITPLLCLADYLLFAGGRRLKYRDVYYTCIFPFLYFIFAMIVSFTGYVYNQEVFTGNKPDITAAPVKVPYFFLDYEKIGGMVAVYVLILMAFIILMGHIFYFIDQKIRKHA